MEFLSSPNFFVSHIDCFHRVVSSFYVLETLVQKCRSELSRIECRFIIISKQIYVSCRLGELSKLCYGYFSLSAHNKFRLISTTRSGQKLHTKSKFALLLTSSLNWGLSIVPAVCPRRSKTGTISNIVGALQESHIN